MKIFLSKLTFLSLLIFACSLGVFAQGGSTTVAVPAEYLNWPNQASQYRVCSGFNASGAPCTPATIYTDLTLASSITQPITVPSTGLLTINATPGPYTLQFFNASGGSGYFNYNIMVIGDSTKLSDAVANIVDDGDVTKVLNFQLSGMATGKTLTIAGSSANSRTYTLGDNGGNGSFNVFSSIPATVQQPPLAVFLTGSAYTNATTTFSNVTGLAFPVSASVNYHAVCRITWQGSAGTTGPKYQFTGPSAPTAVTVGMNSVVTATTVISASAVAFSSAVANTGTVTTATNFTDTVDLGVVNGVNSGTVQLQAAANGAGTLTIQPGSYCTVQ